MRRLLKIAGASVGAVILVVVIAALAVPYLIDLQAFEDRVAAAVQSRTGRALRLEGEARLALLPWPGLDLQRVALGNPPGFARATFARAERVQVRLRLLPLVLERRLAVRRVRIEGLRLRLTRNRAGAGNWAGLIPRRGEPEDDADALAGLLSGRIELRDASAHFQDTADARSYRVTNLRFRSDPVSATASPLALAFDFRGDVPAVSGHLSASAGLARTAAGDYRFSDASVHASLGPGGMRLILSTEAELDTATGTLAFDELRLEAPELHVAGVRVEAAARAGATVDPTRRTLSVDELDLSANLFGQRIPGGATELTARGTLALDLRTGTLEGRDLRLRLPALIGRGVAGNVTARAQAAADLGRGMFSVDALTVTGEFGGAKVPGGALSLRAGARLEGDLEGRRLDVSALHIAGAGLDARGTLGMTDPWTDPRVGGTLHVAPFSPRALLKRFGPGDVIPSDANALAEAELTTEIQGSAQALRLSPLRLRLDDNEIRGSVAVTAAGDPALGFDLVMENVDLDRYLPLRKGSPDASAHAGAAVTQAPGGAVFSALRAWDVAGRLRIGTAHLRGATLKDVEIAVDDFAAGGEGDSVASAFLAGMAGVRAPRALAQPPRP